MDIDEYRRQRAEQDRERRQAAYARATQELRGPGQDVVATPLYAGEVRALAALLDWWPVGTDEPLTHLVDALGRDLEDRWEAVAGHSLDEPVTTPPQREHVDLANTHGATRRYVEHHTEQRRDA